MDNIDMLVSIIVPVYKVEKYLNRCINSIINQSYRNLEIILVDDGSPDNCGKVCDEYAEQDKRIKVIHKCNGGLSSARNAGLDIANGDYIYFVDSDDYIDAKLVEDNLNLAIEHNADMVCFNYFEVRNNYNINELRPCVSDFETNKIIDLFYSRDINPSVWSKFYKKYIWDNLRFPEGMNFEDFFVLPFIIEKCNNIVCNDNAYYYYYISNVNSITNTTGKMKALYLDSIGYMNFIIVAERNKWEDRLKIVVEYLCVNVSKLFYFKFNRNSLNNEELIKFKKMIKIVNKYKKKLTLRRRISLMGINGCRLIKWIECLEYRIKYKNI